MPARFQAKAILSLTERSPAVITETHPPRCFKNTLSILAALVLLQNIGEDKDIKNLLNKDNRKFLF